MGGYNSNRWGGKHIRTTTGDSLFLDITNLKPCLEGGTWSLQRSWKRGDRDAGSVSLHVSEDRVICAYTVTRGTGEPEAVRDELTVTRTACNYGGERSWFLCPRCETRRRVLYLPPGATHFRCRECHNLAYSTQQMDPHDRHLQRVRTLHDRLNGSKGEYSPWQIPPKPKGMRWRTYDRLFHEVLVHEIARNKILQARFEVPRAQWVKQGVLPN